MDKVPRQRGIFPLQVLDKDNFVSSSSLSRSVLRRVRRRLHCDSWLQDGLKSLNELGGYSEPAKAGVSHAGITVSVVDSLKQQYAEIPPRPPDLSSEGALRALLHKSSAYSSGRADVASYNSELLAVPSAGDSPAKLEGLVAEGDLKYLVGEGVSMLRNSDEAIDLQRRVGLTKPHCDPILFRSPRFMLAFSRN
ncbi:unnamed protein product [Polarella glacialis]|uniref:Uncharacterized protein n=1 Tax=Polarella glacialis TaxID=89957 RepID=A0A813HKT9_POLGL|nr:unnamed protein product [Polarella glacialis]